MEEPRRQTKPKAVVWDCGSSLYDSVELKSFQHQLDSAIGRTGSMPHLSESRRAPLVLSKRSSSKFSQSVHKFFRSVFGRKRTSSTVYQVEEPWKHGVYFVRDRSNVLSTIPEVSEHGGSTMGDSTEFNSIARRTVSERFTTSSVAVFCS